jgi:hypothetical protein
VHKAIHISIQIGVHNLMVMVLLQKKYYSMEVELELRRKVPLDIVFTVPVLVLEKIFLKQNNLLSVFWVHVGRFMNVH